MICSAASAFIGRDRIELVEYLMPLVHALMPASRSGATSALLSSGTARPVVRS
jgi:hypothetical protein